MICQHLSPARSSLRTEALYQVINRSASNYKVFSVAQESGHIQQSSWPISWLATKLSWLRSLDKYRNAVGLEYADSGHLWGFDIWEAEQANEGCRDHSLCNLDEPRRFTPSHWLMIVMNSANCERCIKLWCLCCSHTMCTVWNTNEERKTNHDGEIHNIIVTITTFIS